MKTGPCFYCPDLPGEGDTAQLAEQETRHASASRRIKVGDTVGLIDGRGTHASALVQSVARQSLTLVVSERRSMLPPEPSIVVASAVPKGERFRTLVDMLSQIGVTGILPLLCERSAVQPKGSAVDRWRRIAIEACKQSRNPFVPEIEAPTRLPDSLARITQGDDVVFAEAGGGALNANGIDGRLFVYVGPEGGFTTGEKDLLVDNGARPVGLGDNILRVETAALAAAVLGRLSGQPSAPGR